MKAGTPPWRCWKTQLRPGSAEGAGYIVLACEGIFRLAYPSTYRSWPGLPSAGYQAKGTLPKPWRAVLVTMGILEQVSAFLKTSAPFYSRQEPWRSRVFWRPVGEAFLFYTKKHRLEFFQAVRCSALFLSRQAFRKTAYSSLLHSRSCFQALRRLRVFLSPSDPPSYLRDNRKAEQVAGNWSPAGCKLSAGYGAGRRQRFEIFCNFILLASSSVLP